MINISLNFAEMYEITNDLDKSNCIVWEFYKHLTYVIYLTLEQFES